MFKYEIQQYETRCKQVQFFTNAVPAERILLFTNIVDLPQQIFGEQVQMIQTG
jgi:hypothetical protein